MTADYVHDSLCVALPAPGGGVRLRHWWLRQPPPTVAFALQSRLAAALGPAADAAVRLAFRLVDPEAEEALEAATRDGGPGEALALQAWRRARSGQAVSDGLGSRESIVEAGERLRAVLAFVARHTGAQFDGLLLAGESEQEQVRGGPPSRRWTRAGLLHVLLHESKCRFRGEGEQPRAGTYAADAEDSPGKRLAAAADGGSLPAYVAALDAVLASPEELALLCAWAALTLYRPF